jgi:hypothetical protein
MTMVNPGPWVNPEAMEAEPWKSPEGIVKFLEFPVPIEGMSPRAFHLHWQKHHSPTAMYTTPFSQFMRKYNSSHKYPGDPLRLPSRYRQDTRFEGAAEVWLNRLSEVTDWLGNPLYSGLIQPDEPRFIDQNGTAEIIISKEERLYEPELDMAENLLTKVYLLITKPSLRDFDDWHGSVSKHGRLILSYPSLKSRLRKLVISHKLREPLPIEGMEMSPIDAIVELWFSDLDAGRQFFDDPAQVDLANSEAALIDGKQIRGLVAKMRVVHDEFSFQPSTTQPMAFSW